MISIAFSFLAGNMVLHCLPTLSWLMGLSCLPILLVCKARLLYWQRVAVIFFLGFFWAWLIAYLHLNEVKDFNGGQFQATIVVDSIPAHKITHVQFIASLIQADGHVPSKLRLSVYEPNIKLQQGDVLKATIRLKPVHGYMNPGGFDYEKYLFMQKIGAVGYMKHWQLLEHTDSPFTKLRNLIYQGLLKQMSSSNHAGLILALAMGERANMTEEHWDLLAASGVGHLFAISGLHISLLFGLMFFIFKWIWGRYFLCRTGIPRNTAAALLALPFAFFYAWLAGFSIPTQRALLMLVCVVIGQIYMRRMSLGDTLAWALIIILLVNPLNTLSVAFWFSFLAVFVIVLFISTYRHATFRQHSVGLYIYIPYALLPATLLFFQHGALIAPLANMIAIPFVSFIVLPVCLLAALFASVNEWLCHLFVQFADFLFTWFIAVAQLLTRIDFLQWFHHPPIWAYIPAVIGLSCVAILSGIRKKLFAVILSLSLTAVPAGQIAPDTFQVTFLDVGQGLAVVIQTADHALLFDTGAKYPSGFDLGKAVVIPYLRSRNITELDVLIVSHGDNDHIGGSQAILERIPVQKRYMGGGSVQPEFQPCERDTVWVWDNIRFELLHPGTAESLKGNDASCVLKISNARHSVLLTADIEKAAEYNLLSRYDQPLQTEVILVPHHGSLTSSTAEFVRRTQAKIAVVSSGFRNRFGFPKPAVMERYRAAGTIIYNTADSGALQFIFSSDERVVINEYRADAKRYWHDEIDKQKLLSTS